MIDIFGPISPPPGVKDWMDKVKTPTAVAAPGLVFFATAAIRLIIVFAGVYTLISVILAGFGFITAGGDTQKITTAWSKIWQSLLGLLVIAGSFILAVIFGWLLFKDPMAIISPNIVGPDEVIGPI